MSPHVSPANALVKDKILIFALLYFCYFLNNFLRETKNGNLSCKTTEQ